MRERLVVGNYLTNQYVTVTRLAHELLDACGEWQSREAIGARFAQVPPRSLTSTLTRMVAAGLLERSVGAPPQATRTDAGWQTWHPAGLFHFATRDVPFSSVDAARVFEARRAASTPMPATVKRYPEARLVKLPAPATRGALPAVLLARRTWRRFGRGPVEAGRLSTLLWLTLGVQREVTSRDGHRLTLRTAPSGGARHPIEAYVLAKRVRGVKAGLYHYAADVHALERVSAVPRREAIESYLPHQWWYDAAPVAVVFTAVFARSQWRYPYARAYRAVLAEAGHVCQNFCLVATWLGLAPFCSMAMADSVIDRDLGIDGVTEASMYVAGVGPRPAGSSWEPLPAPGADDPFARPD